MNHNCSGAIVVGTVVTRFLLRLSITSILFVSLVACQSSPKLKPIGGENEAGQGKAALADRWLHDPVVFEDSLKWALTNDKWKIVAKVGMSTPTIKESANLVWQKTGGVSTLRLFGPLGIGSVRIQVNELGATLRDNKGNEYFSDDAESLLLAATGWTIPVDALAYWALAIPSPELAYEYQLDQFGVLTALRQKGWNISYAKYQPLRIPANSDADFESVATESVPSLPRKILAEKKMVFDGVEQSIKVRFIIKSFSTNQS